MLPQADAYIKVFPSIFFNVLSLFPHKQNYWIAGLRLEANSPASCAPPMEARGFVACESALKAVHNNQNCTLCH